MSTTTPERVSPRTSLNGLYTQPVDALSFEAVDPVNHPPNKASQWTIDPELMSFRLMHNAIRAEATKFESLLFKLGDRALAAWEIDAIKDWWAGHYEHVTNHHKTEDAIVAPFVRSRVVLPDDFRTSHDVLDSVAAAVDDAVTRRGFHAASEIAPTFHAYRTALYPHLVEEERVFIPLLRAYFTQEETFAAFARAIRASPKLSVGSLLHHLAGGKEGVMTYMARSGYPWHAWYTELQGTRAAYREKMESKLESLLRGAPGAFRRKDDFQNVKVLRPLSLNERLVREPSAAGQLASRIHAEMSSGKLTAEQALREAGSNAPVAPRARLAIGV